MQNRWLMLAGVAIVLLIAIGLGWLTQGTGVIRNDPERQIWIPEELTIPLQVQVAYDGRDIFFRYRWPAREPHIYIDMLRYENGRWVRYGSSPVGPQPHGLYEDRVTMLVDDGSVPEFARYGGYITIGDRMRFFSDQASAQEVSAHPHLGERLGQTEVRKYLPATRSDPGDWRSVVDEETLRAQREAGYFLDLWHWRAHRSNPIGVSDDEHVAEFRFGDAGRGPFFTNWDGDNQRPSLMFDPEQTGVYALSWEDVAANRVGTDSLYYLAESFAVPFDPDHDWQEGDTIPRRVLREGDGSHADIRVHGEGRWSDGQWDVTLVRAMDTGQPLDDKTFRHQGVYSVAFAVHRHATGSRWHYVSLPFSLGLERDAEIRAHRFDGSSPAWDQPWTEVTLFYPGQVNWPLVTNRERHAGAEAIERGIPVKARHTERQLAVYGVEMEFLPEIRRQWRLTLWAGLLLIAALGVALIAILSPRQEERV